MTDDIKAIRDALAAGPTPGPWNAASRGEFWHETEGDVRKTDTTAIIEDDIVGAEFVQPISYNETTRGQVWFRDAQYIAACHPERIARLLDALEQAQKDAARYRWLRQELFDDEIPRVQSTCMGCIGSTLDGAELDTAIDAAMSDAPGA